MVLILFGSAGQTASNWLSILPLLWMPLERTPIAERFTLDPPSLTSSTTSSGFASMTDRPQMSLLAPYL